MNLIVRKISQARLELALAVASVLLILAVSAPFWNVPLNRDQGVYATCADLFLRGGTLITSCWDTKGPLLHVTYALAFMMLGRGGYAPYVLNTLAIAASALVITRILGRWLPESAWRSWAAFAGGLLYGLMAAAVRYDMNAQPESFANLFFLLGLWGLTEASHSDRAAWWLPALSGAAMAAAVLYKYGLIAQFGLTAVAYLGALPASWRAKGRLLALMVAGALGLAGLLGLYLLAHGQLIAALRHIRFLFQYFPQAQLNPDEFALRSRPFAQTLGYLARVPMLYLLGLAGLIWAAVARRWFALPSLAYAAAGVALVWAQQRFTPYHWTVVLPPLAMGFSLLLHEVMRIGQGSPARWKAPTITAVCTAALINAAVFFYVDQWGILGGYLSRQATPEAFHSSQGTWDQMQAAQYIAERTTPQDGLWVWGHHSAIYHLAERYPPTRFNYNEPLLMRIRGGHPFRDAWRQEALEAVLARPPQYIVLTTFDRTFFDFQNPNVSWAQIEAYNTLTEHYYVKETEFGRFQFYRLLPYWDRRLEPSLLQAVTHTDLLENFGQAQILQQVEPEIAVIDFLLFPEAPYPTLLMHAGGSVAYDLRLPEGAACLRFDAAMFPDSWAWGVDGASFSVDVEAGSPPERLYEAYISNAPADQRWHPTLIDLSAYAGQAVRLIFSTGPGPNGDFTGDWAGWGQPRIVQPPQGGRCDADAITWR